MAERRQNIVKRLQASASMTSPGGEDEAEIPMFSRVDNIVPWFAESAPQSQTVQPPRASRLVCPSCIVEEEEGVILLDEVESDSDLGSDGTPMEDEEEEEGNFWIVDDEGENGVAEGQTQNHHATASTSARQSNSDGGLWSSSTVNNPSEAIPVVLTDPDVLDCPICLEPLCAPIYQCENGHIACSPCCTKSNRKCPSCCLPIGVNRCRAMEKLIESIKVDCENKAYGCLEPLTYHMKAAHEQTCFHKLCFCPLSSCGFASSYEKLYRHFSTHHSSSATSFTFETTFHVDVRRNQKHTILQERNAGFIFILNHEIHEHGRVLNVDCLAIDFFKIAFAYKLTVRCLETCFSIESVPEICAKREQHTPKKNYLTIPSEYSRFIIEVCIKRAF